MTEKKENLAIATPGVSYQVKIGSAPATSRVNFTTGAFVFPFDRVKSLLSNKPLKRPIKTRPTN